MADATYTHESSVPQSGLSDVALYASIAVVGGTYVLLLIGMLVADVIYLAESPAPEGRWRVTGHIMAALADPKIQYSIKLTLVSCFFTAILSVMVAVPIGYFLSRFQFPGRSLLDAVLDIPIVLPPLVVGLSLLMLFKLPLPGIERASKFFVYQTPGVVLAQFMVAAAFAVRIMRSSFDQIDTRLEKVAMTLGSSRAQAFGRIVLPQAWQGMLTAGTMAWARALGEFGPLLIFVGTTRMKTEVLSTTVYLEQSVANVQGAVAVSLIMVMAAVAVLVIARVWGSRTLTL